MSYTFTEEEQEKLSNPLISNFLNDENNHLVFQNFTKYPNFETNRALNIAFQSFYKYKRVKVISYIDKLISFFSIDLDKKRNKYNATQVLILDKPVRENDEMTIKDNLPEKHQPDLLWKQFPIEELLENLKLYKAWHSLSEKQKEILRLKYQYGLKDIEIADVLSETKQVIFYNHKKAIKTLRNAVTKN